MQKVLDWAKGNPRLASAAVAMVFMALGTVTGWQFSARVAGPGEQPGITIVFPDDVPDIFSVPGNDAAKQAQAGVGSNVAVGVKAEFMPSEEGRRALRVAGGELRKRRADREPFFAMLRDLHNNPASIEQYEEIATNPVSKMDPATVTLAVKIAVKVAIAILERTAPNTRTEFDNRVLSLLKLFDQFPFVLPGR